jgi:hypothetical protein
MHASVLISFDRYTFCLAPCKISRWVIHLGFAKQASSSQKFTTGNRKVSKKVNCPNAARPPYFKPRISQTLMFVANG